MIRAFLFDLDGVLTDTSEYHFLAWKRLGEDLQIPFDREQNEALRGISRRESLALLLQGKKVTEEKALQLMERKNQYYVEYIKKLTPSNVLPGTREILIECNSMGLKRMIVSASKNAALVIKFLQIGDLIDGVVDGTFQARSKPAPDLFLLAAKALDLEPQSCLVLEDAAAGIEAAHAAGMPVVGLGPVERVGEADLVLPSLEGQSAKIILKRIEERKFT
jgi:beta-phosphoglucomutase